MNEEALQSFKIILIIMQLMAFSFGAIFGISLEKRLSRLKKEEKDDILEDD